MKNRPDPNINTSGRCVVTKAVPPDTQPEPEPFGAFFSVYPFSMLMSVFSFILSATQSVALAVLKGSEVEVPHLTTNYVRVWSVFYNNILISLLLLLSFFQKACSISLVISMSSLSKSKSPMIQSSIVFSEWSS